MMTYGEAFYYFAWRSRQALKRADLDFDPVGVKHVRNRMIEHPEKPKGVRVTMWALGNPQGLLLGPWGDGDGNRVDQGLYPNAQEFVEKLLLKIGTVTT